jgi:hypothetical protein
MVTKWVDSNSSVQGAVYRCDFAYDLVYDLLAKGSRKLIFDLSFYEMCIHGHSSRLPDRTRHLPASRAATTAGVCWGRQLE